MSEGTSGIYELTRRLDPPETAPAIEEQDGLNDDVMIEVAPDRPRGTIRVQLVYVGRSTPLPADDPWAE